MADKKSLIAANQTPCRARKCRRRPINAPSKVVSLFFQLFHSFNDRSGKSEDDAIRLSNRDKSLQRQGQQRHINGRVWGIGEIWAPDAKRGQGGEAVGTAPDEGGSVGVIGIRMDKQKDVAVKQLDRPVELATEKIDIGHAQPVAGTGQVDFGSI